MRLTFIVLLLICGHPLLAQTYTPMLNTTNEWQLTYNTNDGLLTDT